MCITYVYLINHIRCLIWFIRYIIYVVFIRYILYFIRYLINIIFEEKITSPYAFGT